MMPALGIILIIVVIALLLAYFKWSKNEAVAERTKTGEQKVTIIVEGTYNPNQIKVKRGQPLRIIFDRREDSSCSKKVIFNDFGITAELADFGKTEVLLTPSEVGEFSFSCEMGMYQGKLIVEE